MWTHMEDLKTNSDALTLALTLALTAPTEIKAKECIKYAEMIASKMTEKEVAICQKAAKCVTEYMEVYK
tara:strand:- start:894 stop:1100 length:207 start_codon:yes stop_codon:yes gene_type:complete